MAFHYWFSVVWLAMLLPTWVQEAVEMDQDLSVSQELWRHATAVKREEKNHEMEFKRLTMERDVQENKQALERNRRKKGYR